MFTPYASAISYQKGSLTNGALLGAWMVSMTEPRRMTHETEWNRGDFSRESEVCHVAEAGEHETHSRASSSETRGGSLAYEMWLTRETAHGPVEERGAAEGLLREELQRRGPQKRSGHTTLKKNVSK
jgi:hypothetical protein